MELLGQSNSNSTQFKLPAIEHYYDSTPYGYYYTVVNGKLETGNFMELPRKKKKVIKNILVGKEKSLNFSFTKSKYEMQTIHAIVLLKHVVMHPEGL